MQKKDMPEVVAAINGLCDVFTKPKPTLPAIEHWWEAMKEFPLHNVLLVLNTWARDSSKMPTPHDVWERLNNMRTAELEEKARIEKEAEKNAPYTACRTEYGSRMLKAIRDELGMKGGFTAK